MSVKPKWNSLRTYTSNTKAHSEVWTQPNLEFPGKRVLICSALNHESKLRMDETQEVENI